jgi:hypothetical protein
MGIGTGSALKTPIEISKIDGHASNDGKEREAFPILV